MGRAKQTKTPCNLLNYKGFFYFDVVRSGLEPELFWTKTRRVANYTIGQFPTVDLMIGLQK